MIKSKKKISILTSLLLIVSFLSITNYTHVKAASTTPNYENFVNSIRNVNSKTINENGKLYKIIQNGQAVNAKIKIKDSNITGSLSNIY
jgi:hypothetical protein